MFLFVMLAACTGFKDDSGGNGGCAEGDPCVEVGNGETSHAPLAEGDHVVMVHGPQGGWHIWGSLKTWNLSDIVTIVFTIDDQDTGVRISDNTYNVAMVAGDADNEHVYYGLFGFLDADDPATADVVEIPPDVLAGHTVRLAMTVTNADDGTSATASVDVIADPDPCDLDDSCAEDTGSR